MYYSHFINWPLFPQPNTTRQNRHMTGTNSSPKGWHCWLWPIGGSKHKSHCMYHHRKKLGVRCQNRKNLVSSGNAFSSRITSHGWVPKYHTVVIYFLSRTFMKTYPCEYLQVIPFLIESHGSRKSTYWKICAINSIFSKYQSLDYSATFALCPWKWIN